MQQHRRALPGRSPGQAVPPPPPSRWSPHPRCPQAPRAQPVLQPRRGLPGVPRDLAACPHPPPSLRHTRGTGDVGGAVPVSPGPRAQPRSSQGAGVRHCPGPALCSALGEFYSHGAGLGPKAPSRGRARCQTRVAPPARFWQLSHAQETGCGLPGNGGRVEAAPKLLRGPTRVCTGYYQVCPKTRTSRF